MVVRSAKAMIAVVAVAVVASALAAQASITAGDPAVAATWQSNGSILVQYTYPKDIQCYLYRQDDRLSNSSMTNWVQVSILPRYATDDPMLQWIYKDHEVEPGHRYKYRLRAQAGITQGLEWITLAESDWAGGSAPEAAPTLSLHQAYGLIGLDDDVQYEIGTSTDNGATWSTRYVTKTGPESALPPSDMPNGALIRARKAGNDQNVYGYVYWP